MSHEFQAILGEEGSSVHRTVVFSVLAAAALSVFDAALAQPEGTPPVVDLRELNLTEAPPDLVARLYQKECAVCHGEAL